MTGAGDGGGPGVAEAEPPEDLGIPLRRVLREWGRIGCTGFGGPPAHIRLLRALCVERERWLSEREFEDAIAACNLLPGPASTQLAIFCGWRVRGPRGALVGGAAFIVPGLTLILALAALFLSSSPPRWVIAAGAGAGAAVPAVAVQAGWSLLGASWRRRARAARWLSYLAAGTAAAALAGPWVVLVLLGCGLVELASAGATRPGPRGAGGRRGAAEHGGGAARRGGGVGGGAAEPGGGGLGGGRGGARHALAGAPLAAAAGALGGGVALSVAWVAFKVGALSYGGGFVIVPLMQSDAVSHYHWLTGGQFLNAVALGQVTPGPVVQTVAVVGFAAGGLAGGLLAAVVAFAPSFAFVLLGAPRFGRLREDTRAQAFLGGAGPAAIGAIFGSAVSLARALAEPWQYAVLAGAAILLLGLRRGVVVVTLLAAGVAGVILSLAGLALPR